MTNKESFFTQFARIAREHDISFSVNMLLDRAEIRLEHKLQYYRKDRVLALSAWLIDNHARSWKRDDYLYIEIKSF